MNNQIEINQNAGLGSHGNTFIAEQYNGLSVADATHMAFSMFREYYPQLREELLSDLRKMLEEKLKNVPPENIVPPSPRIAVPTLQNASITEDIEIRELYAQLLANSMNETMKDGIHPAFVEIINQLSSDEAKILLYLSTHPIIPIITLRCVNENGMGFDVVKNFSNVGELSKCEHSLDVNKYFDNLIRLGLLGKGPSLSSLNGKDLYTPLKEHQSIVPLIETITRQAPPFNKPRLEESYMSITDFGKSFCEICLCTTETITLGFTPNP